MYDDIPTNIDLSTSDNQNPNLSLRWIGDIGCELLRDEIEEFSESAGALLALEKFELDNLYSIIESVLRDPALNSEVEFIIPRKFKEGAPKLDVTWFPGDAGGVRNTLSTSKRIVVTAIGHENIPPDSLRLVGKINKDSFFSRQASKHWFDRFLQGDSDSPNDQIALDEQDSKILYAALRGFLASAPSSLNRAADYLRKVRKNIIGGTRVTEAFGEGLPTLNLPKDRGYFLSIRNPDKFQSWKKEFESLYRERGNVIDGSFGGEYLTTELLNERLEEIKKFDVSSSVLKLFEVAAQDPSDPKNMTPLLDLDWEDDFVGMFLTIKTKREKKSLSAMTIECLKKKMPSGTDAERQKFDDAQSYLEELKTREKNPPISGDTDFFNSIWPYIADNRTLVRSWEKFIYPSSLECTDFAEGLLRAVISLFRPDIPNVKSNNEKHVIHIAFQAKQPRNYTEKLSPEMMQYFGIIYRDLRELLGDSAIWHTNFRSQSPDPLLDWTGWVNAENITQNTKGTKDDAWFLRFIVYEEGHNGEPKEDKKISLIWRFTKNSLAGKLHDFVKYLKKIPLQQMKIRPANDLGKNGIFCDVTLTERDGLTKGKPDFTDIDKLIQKEVAARTGDLTQQFKDSYAKFKNSYVQLISDLPNKGFEYTNAALVLKNYEAVLEALDNLPHTEKNRTSLAIPFAAIGTIHCEVGKSVFEIIPPWHPMRIHEIARQHREAVSAIREILSGNKRVQIGSEFPIMIKEEAEEPQFPPMIISFDKDLLSGGTPAFATEHNHWFTLCSLEEREQLNKQTHADSCIWGHALKEFSDAFVAYKSIEPLNGNDVKLLVIEANSHTPDPLLRKNLKDYMNETDVELTLQNENWEQSARIFNTLTSMQDVETEALPTTLASFRTRVTCENLKSILNSYYPAETNGVRPFHLALINMLGTKQAEFKWVPVRWVNITDENSAKPGLVDRRKYTFTEETLSQVLLVRPELTRCSAAFLRHLYHICERDSSSEAYKEDVIFLPIREVRTDQSTSNQLGQALISAHKLADWVVTCDSMLTKQQISHNQVVIIRSKRSNSSNISTIISSSSSADSLSAMLNERLLDLGLSRNEANLDGVRSRLFEEALSISGYVGLRAAKKIEFAGELIGLCLSKSIVSDMFLRECERLNKKLHFLAFLMLDDYASWFAKECSDKSIADIIALGLTEDEKGENCLHLIITESKYCKDLSDLKRSRFQLENTLRKFVGFLANKGTESRTSLSIRVWLNRFANMILDSDLEGKVENTDQFYLDLYKIRNGKIKVTLNGYSHYFAFQEKDSSCPTEHTISGISYYQQVFGKDSILGLLKRITEKNSVAEVVCPSATTAECAYHFQAIELQKIEPFNDNNTENSNIQLINAPNFTVGKFCTSSSLLIPQSSPTESVCLGTKENKTEGIKYGHCLETLIAQKAHPLRYSKERLEWCDLQANQLKFGLNAYGISVKEKKHIPTPNGCLVVYEGNAQLGTKVIDSLKEQLLMTRSLRIIFSEAAEGEFRIFIESPKRETVSMWNMWKDRELRRNKDGTNTSIVIALKEADGSILYLDPLNSENDPHTLIAGGTGSGKSVLVQTILADIAVTNPPELSKIFIIDTKNGVDYAPFRTLPHLARPVIDDLGEAVKVFDEIIEEMNHRYSLFSKAECENLCDYNLNHPNSKLPIIWVFHDELAEAMSDKDYCREVTPRLKMLATKARAAGIFLFFVAQRPDKDAVPMQVRDNLGNRLALKLKTVASSKIALDCSGAECLLGKGHIAARIGNSVIFGQCPFLGKEDLREVASAILKDFDNK